MIGKMSIVLMIIALGVVSVKSNVRGRRQVVNCTPMEIETLKSIGINVKTSQIDCKQFQFKDKKGKKMNDPGYGPYDNQYCCSPTCDRYMAHMGIKPKFVEC